MMFFTPKAPPPTSTVCGKTGVWAQFQPQQLAPPMRLSVEASRASRLSLHELWCAEFTPEDVGLFPGEVAATPCFAHGVWFGSLSTPVFSFYGAPPARPFSQPANLPGSVERGASFFC